MRKLVVGLIALFALAMSVHSVKAQNSANSYTASGIGVPGFILNSGGTSWGQVCSSASASSWNLNDNTTAGTCGTPELTWDTTPAVTANVPLVLAKTQVGTGDSAALGVFASTVVPVTSSYESLISSGGIVTLISVPNISTTTVVGGNTLLASGTFLVLSSTATSADAVVLQSSATLAGSQLALGAATRSINGTHTIELIWDAADKLWREISYR